MTAPKVSTQFTAPLSHIANPSTAPSRRPLARQRHPAAMRTASRAAARAAAATQGAALWRASIALQQQLRASPTLNLGLAALACRPPRAQLSAEPVGEAQLAPRPAARRGAAATSLARHPRSVQRAPPPAPPRARARAVFGIRQIRGLGCICLPEPASRVIGNLSSFRQGVIRVCAVCADLDGAGARRDTSRPRARL